MQQSLKRIGKSGIAVLTASLLLTFAGCKPGGKMKRGKPVVPVVTDTVRKGEIVQKIHLNGEIKGQNQADIYPDVPGKVLNLLVREGQFVGRDQIVATVDRSQVGQVYMPASVRSPIAGVIGKIYVDRGQTVSMQTPLMMVADTRFVEGVLHIPEKYVPLFRIGQTAEIRTESYPGKVFTGIVYKVASMIDPTTRTLEVKLRLINMGGRLIPGNYADFTVTVRKYPDQILAPFDSIVDNLEQTDVFVVSQEPVKDDNPGKKPDGKKDKKNKKAVKKNTKPKMAYVARRRRVVVGIREGNVVQIVSGLKEGDRVVTMGKENIIDGTHLRLKTLASTNAAPAGGGRQ